ncbi:hypothetical protein [Helicobacter sp. T3_23-1056]
MRNNNSNGADFRLLLLLSIGFEKLEEQSKYKIVLNMQDNFIYLFDSNNAEPFDKIAIETYTKETNNDARGIAEKAKQAQHRDKTRVESYASEIIERVRGILEERSRQSRGEGEERKEISRRSRSVGEAREEISRRSRELNQTNNAICFLLRKQILTQQSPIDDRLELKSIHTKYQELKDESNKARAIRTYLELGGVANDEVLAKFGKTINLGKSQNSLKDNDSNPNAPNVSNTQLTNENKDNTNNTTNNPANNATNNPTNNNQNPTNPINKPTNTQTPKRRR